MRIRGIVYDTGFINNGISTKEILDFKIIQKEMHIIKNVLHCNAIRLTGGNADNLENIAKLAAAEGLEIWYCPFTCDLPLDSLKMFLIDAAKRAENLRQMGFEIVFVTGSEISLLNKDFFKEETLEQRLNIISNPILFREQLPRIQQKMNIFLTEIAKDVREFFKGKITYASLPFENVDWNLFDFIATDAGHRSAEIAPYFKKGIQALVNKGKPVAITEFGCCTYHGAAELGARADWIIKWDKNGRASHFDNIYIRDEEEQAQYLLELLEIFDSENVNAVFINTFARYDLPHRTDPLVDLDLASGGIVKVYENKNGSIYTDMPWDPKLAFYSVSNYYRQLEN